jgi:hypothetical protein
MAGACTTNGRYKIAYKVLIENPEGKIPRGKLRGRSNVSIKWILKT